MSNLEFYVFELSEEFDSAAQRCRFGIARDKFFFLDNFQDFLGMFLMGGEL